MKKWKSLSRCKRTFAGVLTAILILAGLTVPAIHVKAVMIFDDTFDLSGIKAGMSAGALGELSGVRGGRAVISSVSTGTFSCTQDMTVVLLYGSAEMHDPGMTLYLRFPDGKMYTFTTEFSTTWDGTHDLQVTFTLPKLDHNYSHSNTVPATCTADGKEVYTCTGCGASYDEKIDKTGHNYTSAITKEATCAQAGVRTYTCQNCNDQYTENIPATGNHTYPAAWTLDRAATAKAEGLQYKLCTVCGNRVEEALPTLKEETTESTTEEDTEETTTEEDTTEEEETTEETAEESSQETKKETPTEETAEESETSEKNDTEDTPAKDTSVEPSSEAPDSGKPRFFERLRNSVSGALANAKDHPVGTGLIAAAGVAVLTGLGFLIKAKKAASAAAKAAKLAAGLPELSNKTVLTYIAGNEFNDAFIGLIKEKPFLSVVTVEKPAEDIAMQVHDEMPDLVILEVTDEASMKETEQDMVNIRAVYEDAVFSILTTEEFLNVPEQEAKLKAMEEAGNISKYTTQKTVKTPETAFNHLILPIYRPELTVENTVSYIGDIADLLGIPGISFITRLYVDGKDIKETAELSEKGVVEKSIIIADIADILGLSQVASVLGLIDDLDTIKGALDKEAGTQDGIDGASAAKDVVDVVSEVLGK